MNKPILPPSRKLLQRAEELFELYFPIEKQRSVGTCVYWAMSIVFASREFGETDYQLVAGSAFWRYLENPLLPSEFGYQFEPHVAMMHRAMNAPGIPEMHAWVKNSHWTIDASTRDLPKTLEKMMNKKWEKKLIPPQTYIGSPKSFKNKMMLNEYVEDDRATSFLLQHLKESDYIIIEDTGQIQKGPRILKQETPISE